MTDYNLLDPGANWCPDCGLPRGVCDCPPPEMGMRLRDLSAVIELSPEALEAFRKLEANLEIIQGAILTMQPSLGEALHGFAMSLYVTYNDGNEPAFQLPEERFDAWLQSFADSARIDDAFFAVMALEHSQRRKRHRRLSWRKRR